MKKILGGVLLAAALLFSSSSLVSANDDLVKMAQEAGYPATAAIAPKSALVMDAETGQILWGHDLDLQRDPASTTKTMVIYLTMEAVKAGKISLDTEVVATKTDQAIANIFELSNNKIVAGVTYTVDELLTMTFVPSSNVTTLMLAHLIHEGDDASFIDLMNATAQELGMVNTIFYNGTGANIGAFQGHYAPVGYDLERYNLTTTTDLAILAQALITKHPEILDFTDDAKVTVKKGTPYEETFETYNHSLPGAKHAFEGVDGLKTGSSPTAGYNSIVTAKRGDRRLIAVVLGASQWGDPQGEFVRHYFVNGLLDHAFRNFEKREILAAGEQTLAGKTYRLDEPLVAWVEKGKALPKVAVEGNQAVLRGVEAATGPISTKLTLVTQPSSTKASKAQSDTGDKVAKTSEQTSGGLTIIHWLLIGLIGMIVLLLVIIFRLAKELKADQS